MRFNKMESYKYIWLVYLYCKQGLFHVWPNVFNWKRYHKPEKTEWDNEIILVSLLLLLFWTKGKSYFNDSRDASCMHARVKSNRKWARTSDKIIQPLHMQWPCPFHAFFNPSLIRKQIIKEKCTHTLLTFHFFLAFLTYVWLVDILWTLSKLKASWNGK